MDSNDTVATEDAVERNALKAEVAALKERNGALYRRLNAIEAIAYEWRHSVDIGGVEPDAVSLLEELEAALS